MKVCTNWLKMRRSPWNPYFRPSHLQLPALLWNTPSERFSNQCENHWPLSLPALTHHLPTIKPLPGVRGLSVFQPWDLKGSDKLWTKVIATSYYLSPFSQIKAVDVFFQRSSLRHSSISTEPKGAHIGENICSSEPSSLIGSRRKSWLCRAERAHIHIGDTVLLKNNCKTQSFL